MFFGLNFAEIARKFSASKRVWLDKGIMTAVVFIFVVLVVVALVLLLMNVYKFPL